MGVTKIKMGTIGSKMGRKFEHKRKAKWVKKKANLVNAQPPPAVPGSPVFVFHLLHLLSEKGTVQPGGLLQH